MTVAVENESSEWNLERRESKDYLVWKRNESKVRFRFDVDVLEYVKDPEEQKLMHENESIGKCLLTSSSISSISSNSSELVNSISNTVIVCATCVAAIAVTIFVPWYLVGSS